ncbi:MAG: hypothetical protein ACI4WT_01120 [Oligosphaeraceae bacterium]
MFEEEVRLVAGWHDEAREGLKGQWLRSGEKGTVAALAAHEQSMGQNR